MRILHVCGQHEAPSNLLGGDAAVTVARGFDAAIQFAALYHFDAVILEIERAEVLLRAMRGEQIATPVIVAWRARDEAASVRALNAGADECIILPIGQSELFARIKALMRRSAGLTQSRVICGALMIDLGTEEVEIAGRRVVLPRKQYQVLELLALKKGAIVTKQKFYDALYGAADEPGIKMVDLWVHYVRRRLSEASGGLNFIETAWGRGYRLREPEPARQQTRTKQIPA